MPLTPLPTLPTAPNSITRPLTFNADSDAYFGTLNSFQVSYNLNVPLLNAASQAAMDGAAAASASATEAVASKVLAAQSAAQAALSEAALAALQQWWLGAHPSDPATGRDGAPLVAGNAYVNTGSGSMRAYNGTEWVQGIAAVAGVSSVNGQAGAVTVQPHLFFFTQGII